MTTPIGTGIPVINPSTGKLYPDDIPGDAPAVVAMVDAKLAAFTPTTASVHTPYYHYAINGTYPPRPATDSPVVWNSWDVDPGAAGTTAGGGGPAPIDIINLAPGVGQ